jgi:hypothetical protein
LKVLISDEEINLGYITESEALNQNFIFWIKIYIISFLLQIWVFEEFLVTLGIKILNSNG